MAWPSGDGKGRPLFSLTSADPKSIAAMRQREVFHGMTIRSPRPDDEPGPGVIAEWRLDTTLAFATGPEVRRFTLRRMTWGWDLTLHDYSVVLDDGITSRVQGLSIAWSAPAEFWRWIEVVEDHDVDRADVLAMLRAPADAVLDTLADELAGAWTSGSTRTP
jgi:hypothetical protein